MLEMIISGGETGAEQAGWRAAKRYGVRTGGWMPRGFLTEDGPRPEFAESYAAAEMPTDSAVARIEQNVQDSDATLWFGVTTSFAASVTVERCIVFNKPCMPIDPDVSFEPSHIATWILVNHIKTLNVTGNSEAEERGIGDRVERFIGQVLQQLGRQQS